MKIAYGITSAPRRVSYFQGTLESLNKAGFPNPLVSYDDRSMGPYRNFKLLVRKLLYNEPDADVLIVFQDDIKVSLGLRGWIEQNFWPSPVQGIGVVSLYCAKPHHFNRKGWHKLPLRPDDNDEGLPEICDKVLKELKTRSEHIKNCSFAGIDKVKVVRVYDDCMVLAGRIGVGQWKWFWVREGTDEQGRKWTDMSEMHHWAVAYGACALALPRENALRLIDGCTHPEAKNKTDMYIAEVCARYGLDFWLHTPSLVEHVGEISTLHNFPINDYRHAELFCEDATALV